MIRTHMRQLPGRTGTQEQTGPERDEAILTSNEMPASIPVADDGAEVADTEPAPLFRDDSHGVEATTAITVD